MKKKIVIAIALFLWTGLVFFVGSRGNPDTRTQQANAELEKLMGWYDAQLENQRKQTRAICEVAEKSQEILRTQNHSTAPPWKCKEHWIPAPTSSVEFLP